MDPGSSHNGKSIELNLIRLRSLHISPPSFEVAQISNLCKWCNHYNFKIGAFNLCNLHKEVRHKNNKQCRYIGRGKYIKGTGKRRWLDRGKRRAFSWFEEIDRAEYNRRIVIIMLYDKKIKDKINEKRGEKRRLKRISKESPPYLVAETLR